MFCTVVQLEIQWLRELQWLHQVGRAEGHPLWGVLGCHHCPTRGWVVCCATVASLCFGVFTRTRSVPDFEYVESLVFLGSPSSPLFFAAFFLGCDLTKYIHLKHFLQPISRACNTLWQKISYLTFSSKFNNFQPFQMPIALQWLGQIKNYVASIQRPNICSLVVYGFHWSGRCLRQKVNNTRFRRLCFIYIDCLNTQAEKLKIQVCFSKLGTNLVNNSDFR